MTSTDAARPFGRLAVLALAACLGCGAAGDGSPRFPVAGTVRHDGRPLKSGTITFTPDGPGAVGSAEVADGAFALDAAAGLGPGGYRVEVYSSQPTGRKVPDPDDPGVMIDEVVGVVDRRYNVASTLRADIPTGGPAGPLTFDVASPSPSSGKAKRR